MKVVIKVFSENLIVPIDNTLMRVTEDKVSGRCSCPRWSQMSVLQRQGHY